MTSELKPVLPSTLWQHYNGNKYEVLLLSNTESERQEKYPTTVVYRNISNGNIYSRKLSDWHRSMTHFEESRPAPAATDTGLVTVGYAHRGTIGLLLEGAVSKAVIVPKAGGDFKTPVMLVEQTVELLAAEIRRERDLAAKQLSEVVDRMSDDYLALKAELDQAVGVIEDRSSEYEALEAKLAAAEPLLTIWDELPDNSSSAGLMAAWFIKAGTIVREARAVLGGKPLQAPTLLRSKVAEYIAARDDYELATKPNGSFGTTRHLKPNDPIAVRYREARAALEAKP